MDLTFLKTAELLLMTAITADKNHSVISKWRSLIGSRKLRKSQIVCMIATKFQRLYPCFRDQATQLDRCEYSPTSGSDASDIGYVFSYALPVKGRHL